MPVPFYRSPEGQHPRTLPNDSKPNLGLWFNRFYNSFDAEDWSVDDSGKKAWIETVSVARGDPKVLEAAAARLEKLATGLGAQCKDFKTEWHLATGLGLNHPVENGFTWHHTLGVPYLPASGVKGMLRGWVEAWMEHADDVSRNAQIARWFGAVKETKKDDAAKEKSEQTENHIGNLIFFDAIPSSVVTLKCDIMTPHMGKWYEKGADITEPHYAESLPADWHSPVPVPFLVVSNATFRFVIAPRLSGNAEKDAQAKADAQEAMVQLGDALQWMGAGAKTAAGYGRMIKITSAIASSSSTTTWNDALVKYDKSSGSLTVTNKTDKKSTTPLKGAQSKKLFESFSESAQKLLKEGKKSLSVRAEVMIKGNQNDLIKIDPLP